MDKKYLKLKNYISKKMSMSHIYQPLMLIELSTNLLSANSMSIKHFNTKISQGNRIVTQNNFPLTTSNRKYVSHQGHK